MNLSINKLLHFILVIIFLCSCSNKIIYDKIYYAKKNPNVFIFYKDSTFRYEYWQSCYTESTGTWRQTKNALCLNSNIQDLITVDYFKEKNTSDTTVLNVVLNISNPQDYICFPVINNDLKYFFAMNRGNYSIAVNVPIDSICFSVAKQPFELRGTGIKGCYDPIRTKQMKLNLSPGEKLTARININDSLFGYKVFTKKKIELKNGKIIYNDGEKDNRLYLKK